MPAYWWSPVLGAHRGKPTGNCRPDPYPAFIASETDKWEWHEADMLRPRRKGPFRGLRSKLRKGAIGRRLFRRNRPLPGFSPLIVWKGA